jgi:hypothetical protein
MCHSLKLHTQKWQESFAPNLTYEKKKKNYTHCQTLENTTYKIKFQLPQILVVIGVQYAIIMLCCMSIVYLASHLLFQLKTKLKHPILGTLHTILMSKLKNERSVKLWIRKHSFKSYCLLEEHLTCINFKILRILGKDIFGNKKKILSKKFKFML